MIQGKIKLVFITISELTQRYFDWFYLDDLSEQFDVEYWDCSSISDNGFHALDRIERDYARSIHTLIEFEDNLKRIPLDSLITLSVLYTKKNYQYLKILAKYFTNVTEVHLTNHYLPTPEELNSDVSSNEASTQKKGVRSIKEHIYQYPILKLAIKAIVHPQNHKQIIDDYYATKIFDMFEWYDMWNKKGAQYYINSLNVDKYIRCKHLNKTSNGKYIVYIDQYFPYHNEFKVLDPTWDADKIAKTHFKKINAFFDKIEEEYGCPIIIAAHPVSIYTDNPFNGREIRKWCTEELVINCSAVLMHQSTAITYAFLANKPLALVVDNEIRNSVLMDGVMNIHRLGVSMLDIDNLDEMAIIEIPPLPTKLRDKYMQGINGGEIDEKNFRSNMELLKENYTKIYHDLYDKKLT